jgi:AAA family ATP:ADP antiporter
LQNSISDKDIRTAYLGSFWNRVNIISFSMQFLITPLVLKRFKIKYVLIFIPLLHLFTSLYSFIFPSLFSAGLVFMIFKSMDYSIYKASKEILYIPFSYDTKYRVKQIVDSFTYRFSKGFISILMSVLNIVSFSYFKIIIPFIMLVSLIWSYIASRIETKE